MQILRFYLVGQRGGSRIVLAQGAGSQLRVKVCLDTRGAAVTEAPLDPPLLIAMVINYVTVDTELSIAINKYMTECDSWGQLYSLCVYIT